MGSREVFGGAPTTTTTTTKANKVVVMSRRVLPLLLVAAVVFLARTRLPAAVVLLLQQQASRLGLRPAAVALACWASAVAAWAYAVSRPRPVYLVELSGYVAGASHEASRAKTIAHFGRCGRFSDESMAFQKRMLERSGLGEQTHLPASLIGVPVDMCLRTARAASATEAIVHGSKPTLPHSSSTGDLPTELPLHAKG